MEPIKISRQDHPISRKDIDPDTLRVLYRLKDEGFESYLVGGAVRDLLMGRHPKDFDIATSARPNELRRLFRNSRVVGRRFKIVHVFFGAKNIEVATLRSQVEPRDDGDLYIDEDNQWGDLESDSFRRDFTVNALYYDIYDFAVIDYTGGLKDLHDHVVRTIGDPLVRFQEDPVRMLRAVKFAARFGYTFEKQTDAALRALPAEIAKASRFRVTEEVFRILTQPNRDVGLKLLKEYGLLAQIYPTWLKAIGESGFAQVLDYFAAAERDSRDGRHYPLEVLTAGLFLPLLDEVDIEVDQYHKVASRITAEIGNLAREMDLPRRLTAAAVDMIRGQYYLLFFHHRPKRVKRFVTYPNFDLVWRVHDLAFRDVKELEPIQELWFHERERLRQPMGGVVEVLDKRDIFSFRGKTGGGRMPDGRNGRGGRGGGRDDNAGDDEWVAFNDEEDKE